MSTDSTHRLRRIAHLDMDAFYASVELLRYPQLKGLPVVIGGRARREDDVLLSATKAGTLDQIALADFPRIRDYKGRGVITTATYAARTYGVGSAMGIMKAAKLCPDAILLPVDFDEYRKYSHLFKQQILAIAPAMENRGVDEVYIDFTDVPGGQHDGGHTLALQLQSAIFTATGLTCSIGVAPNKLLAKMASEFNKPNGISIVYERDIETRVWLLPARKINGIGPRTENKLLEFGIHSIGDIAAREREWLIENFGKSYGTWLHDAAHGRDERKVQNESEPVSMSRETTFAQDLHAVRDKAELSRIFTRLCAQIAADLARKAYVGKTISVKVRYNDFRRVTRDYTAEQYTADATTIRQLAGQCLKRVPLDQPIRLLGVKVGSLAKAEEIALQEKLSATKTGKAQRGGAPQQQELF